MAIRMATVQDVPRILEIYAPYIENTVCSFEYTVPSLADFTQRFLKITRQFPWLVWEEDGLVLGYAYGSLPFARTAYQWSAEASIYLCPQAKGQGIGKKLYAALEDLLQKQGYKKVFAIITTANADSIAFHQAVGYRYVATLPDCGFKFGAWYGTVWMDKELNTWDTPPHAPIPFPELCKTETIL